MVRVCVCVCMCVCVGVRAWVCVRARARNAPVFPEHEVLALTGRNVPFRQFAHKWQQETLACKQFEQADRRRLNVSA